MSNLTDVQENAIIERIKAGESHLFRKLVEQYQRYVFSAAYKIVGQSEDAEDIAQDTFLKAFKSLHQFDGRSKFGTWIYRIAINTAISRRRKRKFHTQDIENTHITSTVSNVNELKLEEQQRYLQIAFDRMKEEDVTILTLFYLKELSLKEISEILELQVNTTKVKLHRARVKMAKEIQIILKDEAKSLI